MIRRHMIRRHSHLHLHSQITAFDPSVKKWEQIPLVRLSALLMKESWCAGATYSYEMKEDFWNKFPSMWPGVLRIMFPYRNIKIQISVYIHDTSHALVVLYQEEKRRGLKITKTAANFPKAIAKVHEVLEAVKSANKGFLDRQDEIEAEIKRQEKQMMDFQREYGISLTKHQFMWVLHLNESYQLRLRPSSSTDEDGNYLFEIDSVFGKFTKEEMKAIMEVVCCNPRAIAEKLSK